MIRRRRPNRDIPFSFDSFLDIVANVVGVIIRLILVVWVGARSYHSVQQRLTSQPTEPTVAQTPVELSDPLTQEIAKRRRELDEAQRKLLDQMRQLELARAGQARKEQQLVALASRRNGLERDRAGLEDATTQRDRETQAVALSLNELRERSRRLAEEIQQLQKLPPPRKTLRYRTPVSRPVQAEEIMFECRAGRIAFIDIAALIDEVRRGMEAKADRLKSQWQVHDFAGPVGAFRLRYTVERERGMLDTLGTGSPDANGMFRYGLSGWTLEPVALVRGEPLDVALARGSAFHQIVDAIDPQTVVTLWVYPDSFEMFRQVRDYLYDRDIIVAGRPLPEGMAISSSRSGSVSRGQ